MHVLVTHSAVRCDLTANQSSPLTPLWFLSQFAVATLGTVEFFLHLFAEYRKGYDVGKKVVFSDVHFLLFYTALINAFQSVLTAVVVTRVSREMWVVTEMVEKNHYVEIRLEFDRVERELFRVRNGRQRRGGRPRNQQSGTFGNNSSQDWGRGSLGNTPRYESAMDLAFEFNGHSIAIVWKTFVDYIRHPALQRKYNKLLVQVRFHELRLHFLQCYDLPHKLSISDYLIRCEQSVLMKLVSVSSTAWLLLTGAVSLVYYVLGMVYYKYKDQDLVGRALNWIFFWCIAVFVIISVLVSNNMKSIFQKIMEEKSMWDVHVTDADEKERLSKQQLALFWGAQPKNIIVLIQFMQFGFAVAISTVVVFWEEISDGDVGMQWFLLAIGLCYTLFVLVTGRVIPRYTLCTSLGQLVDERRLRETVALFRLNEAKQKQLELLEFQNDEKRLSIQDGLNRLQDDSEADNDPSQNSDSHAAKSQHFDRDADLPHEGSVLGRQAAALPSQNDTSLDLDSKSKCPDLGLSRLGHQEGARQRKYNRRKAASEGVASMVEMGRKPSENAQQPSLLESRNELGDLPTARSTSFLATTNPSDDELQDLTRARRRSRRSRMRSVSDGVAMMARLSESENESGFLKDARHVKRLGAGLVNKRPSSPSISRQGTTVETGDMMAVLVKMDAASLRMSLPQSEQKRLLQLEGSNQIRKSRRKVVSDGVAAMAAMRTSMSSAAGNALGAKNEAHDFDIAWKRPVNEKQEGVLLDENLARQRNRHIRKKSLSDSVAVMAGGVAWDRSGLVHPLASTSWDTGLDPARTGHSTLVADVKQQSVRAQDATGGTTTAGVEHDSVPKLSVPGATCGIKVAADDASANSTCSVDGYSDADDVPDTILFDSGEYAQGQSSRPSLRDQLHSYFLSKQHVFISNVLGTIFAFFLVGERVEGFIYNDDIIDEFVSFHFPLKITFWLLTALFSLFLVASGLVFYLHRNFWHVRNGKELEVAMAAVIDTIISSTCLTVLLVAEAKRCCEQPVESHGSLRDLAGVAQDIEYAGDLEYGPSKCACQAFGSRSYGGLGTIEPYTSLVCLRITTHWIARCMVSKIVKAWPKTGSIDDSAKYDDVGDSSFIGDSCDGIDAATVVAKVWEATIGTRPDLVATYGEFSSEILQAMLGVAIVQRLSPATTEESNASAEVKEDQEPTIRDFLQSSKSFSLNKEYAKLSAKAQEVILAGKLGCSVKPASKPNHQVLDIHTSTILEDENEVPKQRAPPRMTKQGSVMFHINTDTYDGENDMFFTSPNARLVRSMRRCERKFLPILDKWTVVDVVMTRFEMIYFDAAGVDESALDSGGEDTRQAIKATSGGKGLRLCDVAVGRRVVGRLSLSDITSVHVERIMPNSGDTLEEDCPDAEVEQTEFWKRSVNRVSRSLANGHGGDQSRGSEWSTIKQDRLKIETHHGHTLFLRFYADLEDAKHHAARLDEEDEANGLLFKNNSFQWVQTIGRFCGPEQLKQHLPHFGADTSDELRDFLVVVDHPAESKGHRRTKSFRNLSKALGSRRNLFQHRSSSLDAGAGYAGSDDGVQSSDAESRAIEIPGDFQTTSVPDPRTSNGNKNLSKKVSFLNVAAENV